ncbi:MAG: GNAT family N-acetyltransferase [Deltaproteobacteria bacterium]|nr:GNAT family N-acetyltransferase [Deltaproteobacteria bacterium]
MRFAIREAKPGDAVGIARAHTESWRSSYRGILPDTVLDRIDVGQRAASRSRILQDPSIVQLVAYDTTHLDIVGFCDAGESRRRGIAPQLGEIYAIYLVHHAKRHGLGREIFENTTSILRARGLPSLIIWVLEHNHHARRFYEAMGGRLGPRMPSTVGGFKVIELGYVWDRL